MSPRAQRGVLGAITALALALRLGWARFVNRPPQSLADPARYVGYAEAISRGKGMVEWTGHPTAYYPPGYPWFAGVVTWLARPFTDQPWTAIIVVQAVIGAVTVLLGARIARELAGPVAGLIAAFVLAVYPNLVYHSGVVLGETLFNALFLGFLASLLPVLRTSERAHPRTLVVSGALLGAAVMVRPISLAVLPVILLARWWAARDPREALRSTALITTAVLACVLPWTIRNLVRMDSFVPISTNTGENLCIGNSPDADGAFTLSDHCDFGSVLESPRDEVEIDSRKTRYALGRVVAEPARQPWLIWRRFWFTWIRDGDHDGIVAAQSYNTDPWMEPGTRRSLARIADVSYWVVAPAGVAGAVLMARRRRARDLAVIGAMLAVATVPLAFFGDARFKVPAIPLLIVLAAAGAGTLLDGRRSDRNPDRTDDMDPDEVPVGGRVERASAPSP